MINLVNFHSDWKVADASRNYAADNASLSEQHVYTTDNYQHQTDSLQFQELRNWEFYI